MSIGDPTTPLLVGQRVRVAAKKPTTKWAASATVEKISLQALVAYVRYDEPVSTAEWVEMERLTVIQ